MRADKLTTANAAGKTLTYTHPFDGHVSLTVQSVDVGSGLTFGPVVYITSPGEIRAIDGGVEVELT
jgi:hypothetical protein